MNKIHDRAIIFVFLISSGFIQVKSQGINAHQLDSLVEKTIKMFEVPGMAVAIIKDGKVIHSKGYGVRSLQSRQKMDENTLFGIASNSKAFTAAALAILAEQGKLKMILG